MDIDVPASVPLISASIGAISALVGVALSFGRDWFVQKLKDGQQRIFVALRLAAELEDFAARCAQAASDYGEPEMQSHGQEEYIPRYPTPELTIDYAGYEWRLIPKDLLMRILELPHMVQRAHLILAEVNEHVAGPPYYEEYYSERSLRFGQLGIRALEVARDLRVRHGAPASIPSIDPEDAYDITNHLHQIVFDVKKSRRASESSV
ncbi:MAG TPA: hypothetical protein VJ673_19400 [Aromatoleum sp.]|uniref:hypothetical protein n=1 Tax=Aromatoleum sp. TaxID=2307007 RepID=UPI002B45E376|nr:hypothetical protein [Aromatoleum sp.]HJV27857.1 hypothetical protein [Aromatoleum sp.]